MGIKPNGWIDLIPIFWYYFLVRNLNLHFFFFKFDPTINKTEQTEINSGKGGIAGPV